MRQVVHTHVPLSTSIRWVGDRRREGADFGVNLGRPIVTNGDFVRRGSSQITLGSILV